MLKLIIRYSKVKYKPGVASTGFIFLSGVRWPTRCHLPDFKKGVKMNWFKKLFRKINPVQIKEVITDKAIYKIMSEVDFEIKLMIDRYEGKTKPEMLQIWRSNKTRLQEKLDRLI